MRSTIGKRVAHVAIVLAVVIGLTVATFGVASAATETSVSVTPSNDTVSVGESVTFDVRVNDVDNGVNSYEFDLSVDDNEVAEITDVSLQGTSADDTLTSVEYAENGSSVSVSAGVAGHDDGVIASVTVRTDAVGTAGISLSNVVIGDDDANSYDITSTNGATLSAVEETVSVDVEPVETTVSTDEATDFDVVVVDASDGVGSYEFDLAVGDSNVAAIENVSLVGTNASDSLTNVSWGPNGTSVSVAAGIGDEDHGRIATISIVGQSNGTTSLSMEGVAIGDNNGSSYTVGSTGSAEITVRAGPAPVATDFGSPTDVDGDGVYEDVNGDGKFDIVDVSALLNNMDSETIQESPEYFDFNGDGEFTIVDVSALLTQV